MVPTYPIFKLDLTNDKTYLCTKFSVNRIEIATSSIDTYRKSFQPQDRWGNITPISLELLEVTVGSMKMAGPCLKIFRLNMSFFDR